MIIACLPSETTYDVQCPVCGRGFLFLTDPSGCDRPALRRSASAALAAQHNKLKARSDRRRGPDRRTGMADPRGMRVERRIPTAERRDSDPDRRGPAAEHRLTDQERRSASPVFRRGSGAAHPRDTFYLQGWDGDADRNDRAWADAVPLQHGALC
ncbi:MAG: hypothetical protein ACRYGF_12075 [Janthinobacterium lividum]